MQLLITHSVIRIPEQSNARLSWSERKSIRLELGLPGAHPQHSHSWGAGEATPLPGFSTEGVDECHQWLQTLELSTRAPQPSEHATELLERLEGPLRFAPAAARFAVEAAALVLWAKRRRQPLGEALAATPFSLQSTPAPFPCPLLDIWRQDFLEQAASWCKQGARRFKIKIGRDVPLEVQRATALSQRFTVRLRLDANQALEPGSFEQTLGLFAGLPIEYVEEPLPLELLGEPRELPIPLAFDESLLRGHRDACLAAWIDSGYVRALVCKPMLLGGVRATLRWHQLAQGRGLDFVLSHLFDGSLAMQVYRALAAWLSPNVSHGLADHAGLSLWGAEGNATHA